MNGPSPRVTCDQPYCSFPHLRGPTSLHPVRDRLQGSGPRKQADQNQSGTGTLPLSSCTRKSRASLSNWQVAGEKETFLLVPSATRVHLRGAGPQDCQTSIIVIPVRPPYRDRVTCRDCMKEAREPLDRAAARSPFQKIRRHAPFPSTTRAVNHLVRHFRPPCPLPARCLLS